jgi:hypothetical protein
MHHFARLSVSVTLLIFLLLPLGASARTLQEFGAARVSRRQLQTQEIGCKDVRTKKVSIGTVALSKVPSSWIVSVAQGESGLATGFDDFPKHIFFSIGQKKVTYGDLNLGQIDVAKMSGTDVRALEEWYKSTAEAGDTWSVQRIGGRSFDVLTFPLDNGQVSKIGTGGRVYFLAWTPKESHERRGKDMGLVIWQQARGDAAFECGMRVFIESLDLNAFAAGYRDHYPSR